MNTKTQEKPKDHPKEPEKKDVALRQTGSTVALPDADFGDSAGKGMEDVTADEMRIPFLYILASNSPQCKPAAQGGTPGAQQGMMMNMGTGELYDRPVQFVPVHRDHNFVEFTPKNLGGGLVAVYPPEDPLIVELRARHPKWGRLPHNITKRDAQGLPLDGTEITETFYLYGMIVEESGALSPVIVPFKSTQIRKYNSFIGRTKTFKYRNPRNPDGPPDEAPIYGHRWLLGTQPESNKKGEYWGWTMSLAEKEADGREAPYFRSIVKRGSYLFQEAEKLRDMIVGGEAKADFKKQEADEQTAVDETPM